jgi:hypothetical protein
VRSRLDGISDLTVGHGVAAAHVHPANLVDHMILNAIIISKALPAVSTPRAPGKALGKLRKGSGKFEESLA